MSTENHTCPRRIEDGTHTTDSPFTFAGPNKDTYTSGHGLIGQARGCSYCGSMHPDDFMEAMRSGKELGVTNKNYKAYVATGDPNGGKFYFQHLSAEQRTEFIQLLNDKQVVFEGGYGFEVLPYFIKAARS